MVVVRVCGVRADGVLVCGVQADGVLVRGVQADGVLVCRPMVCWCAG